MVDFLGKCIIFVFIFIFAVTFIVEKNSIENDHVLLDEKQVLTSSADLYSNLVSEERMTQEQTAEQESTSYHWPNGLKGQVY